MSKMKIEKSNVVDIMKLSAGQLGILYESLKSDSLSQYVAQETLYIYGKMQLELLETAIEYVTERNPMLRCVFRWEKLSAPIQIILKDYKIPFIVSNLEVDMNGKTTLTAKDKDRIRNNEVRMDEHPIVIHVFCHDQEYTELVITWHHIVYDGWSNMILLREIFEKYDNLTTGTYVHEYQKGYYRDFLRKSSTAEYMEQTSSFWKSQFHNYIEKEKQDDIHKIHLEYHQVTIPKEQYQELQQYANRENFNIAMVFYCAWILLLHKMTKQYDLCFGVTVSGRNTIGLQFEQTIGLFINTLPLRIVINDQMKLIDLMNEIKDKTIQLMDNENTNLIDIMKYSNLTKVPFGTTVVVESYPMQLSKWLDRNGEYYIESYESIESNNSELLLGILPPEYDKLVFQYNSERYDRNYIERMADYYITYLQLIIQNCDIRVEQMEEGLYGSLKDKNNGILPDGEVAIEKDTLW